MKPAQADVFITATDVAGLKKPLRGGFFMRGIKGSTGTGGLAHCKVGLNAENDSKQRIRSGIPSCVTKSVANDVAIALRYHLPAASATERKRPLDRHTDHVR